LSVHLSATPPRFVAHSTRIAGGQLSVSTFPLQMPGKPGVRSSVSSFSSASRLRLSRLLFRLPWPNEEVAFVTLTFAEDVDGKFAKSCLNKLHSWFDYQYPSAEVVWKMEYTKRGRQHFHLLARPVPGSPLPDDFSTRLESQWLGRMNCGFILVKQLYNRSGAIRYFSDYLSKKQGGDKYYQEQVPDGVWSGRFWGLWGHPELLPEFSCYLSDHQFEYVLAVVNGRLLRDGVDFRFWASKTSKRYDPPVAYLVRAMVTGESPTAHEWLVMTDDERSRWEYLVDSGGLALFVENFPPDEHEGENVRVSV